MEDITPSPSMEESLSHWFSTYGLITVERTLSLIGIQLDQKDMLAAVQDESSIYHALLQVPVKNILNGIILNQARDYREFAQKMFVEFLLSGSGNAPGPDGPEIQPGSTKDLLEQERLKLIEIGEQYDIEEFEHNKLVAESQRQLVAIAKELKQREIDQTNRDFVVSQMASYVERSQHMMKRLCDYRAHFYQSIIRTRDLIGTLPDYFPDEQKMREKRSALYFDAKIGE